MVILPKQVQPIRRLWKKKGGMGREKGCCVGKKCGGALNGKICGYDGGSGGGCVRGVEGEHSSLESVLTQVNKRVLDIDNLRSVGIEDCIADAS